MNVYTITASHDGDILQVQAQATNPGAQDLGLPGAVIRRRIRVDAGDTVAVWGALSELAEECLEDFRDQCRRADLERFEVDLFGVSIANSVHVRRLR